MTTASLNPADGLTALHLLVAPGHRLLQLLDLHLTRHDLPFLRRQQLVSLSVCWFRSVNMTDEFQPLSSAFNHRLHSVSSVFPPPPKNI